MTYQRFIVSQSIVIMASSIVFPFYILLLRNAGDSYSQFGWAYGMFALSAAFFYPVIGRFSDRIGDQLLLIVYSWAMTLLLLLFPLVTEVWQVYLLQILMGLLGAVQKNTEKTSLVRHAENKQVGKEIGKYHSWTGIGGAIAIILTGYLADFLTIGSIFYIASLMYMASGLVLMKKTKLSKKAIGDMNKVSTK
ncbi:MFS transporter [Peribacillus saganii]|uniref:MFS transporter n=1 Tax=Peribacillus saganii TaxID=2303992 RepID=A0A372LRX2_9BACI|nr:MFS transporter [Peribacillus saganii]RFU70943.1 MFS transporter [Peribacillus saganii]